MNYYFLHFLIIHTKDFYWLFSSQIDYKALKNHKTGLSETEAP
jgi:hypothetical protein